MGAASDVESSARGAGRRFAGWVRRCQKGHARVRRAPGTGPGLEGGEEGRGPAPGRRGGLSGAQPGVPPAGGRPWRCARAGRWKGTQPLRLQRAPAAASQPAPPLRPFGSAPGACRRPHLPPLCAQLEPVPRGGTRVRAWETLTLAGPRAKTRRPLAGCGTVDIPVDLSGLSFHLCKRGIRACLCLWAPWKIRQDLTSVKAFY